MYHWAEISHRLFIYPSCRVVLYDLLMTRSLQIFAWLLLFGIAIATLSPIGLRPHLTAYADLERALAFCVAGLVFALAYPRKIWLATVLTIACIFGLEYLQDLRADRHGSLLDAFVKAGGAAVGYFLGWLAAKMHGQRSIS